MALNLGPCTLTLCDTSFLGLHAAGRGSGREPPHSGRSPRTAGAPAQRDFAKLRVLLFILRQPSVVPVLLQRS